MRPKITANVLMILVSDVATLSSLEFDYQKAKEGI